MFTEVYFFNDQLLEKYCTSLYILNKRDFIYFMKPEYAAMKPKYPYLRNQRTICQSKLIIA